MYLYHMVNGFSLRFTIIWLHRFAGFVLGNTDGAFSHTYVSVYVMRLPGFVN